MDRERLAALLARVKSGELTLAAAEEALRRLPFEEVGSGVVDHHRQLRTGVPEVVLGC